MGCSTEASVVDPFPVPVDLDSGVVLVPVTTVAGADPTDQVLATVDTLSPFTVVDSYQPGEPVQTPRRRRVDLTLYDATSPGVARAQFQGVSALDLHPCSDDSLCQVGADGATAQIGAIIGADVLSRVAVRFDFFPSDNPTLRFFPDIAGDDAARGRACEAVFSRPFAGGGTVSIAGAEVAFSPLRIAIGTCLNYDTESPDAVEHGTAALLLVATGLSTTILSESAYQRYAELVDDPAVAPPVDELPPISLHISSGTSSSSVSGRLGSVNRMALVGEGSSIRGPCQELWANHLMASEACYNGVTTCPCKDNTRFCSTAAAIELATSIQVAVVSDLEPLLQSLRDQLRPQLPELDGLLGVNAMAKLGVDVDYPNNRVVMRCLDTADCRSRPEVRTRTSLPDILGCPGMP